MRRPDARTLTLVSLMIALTTIATIVIQIPIPAVHGYFNLGDAILLTSSLLFGQLAGALTGGLGSMLADLLTGYAHYAPVTLIVKGLAGWLAAFLFKKTRRPLPSALGGGILMAAGYFLYETVLYGAAVALTSFGINLIQGILGALMAYFLYKTMHASGVVGRLQKGR